MKNKAPTSTLLNEMLMKGYSFHQQGYFQEAQTIYQQILNMHPMHFDALQLAGAIALETKQYQQAQSLLSKAIKLRPNYGLIHYNLGIAFQELKNFKSAISSYDKSIILNPDFASAHSNRGDALQSINQFTSAIASYDHAIKLNPHYFEAYSNRGNALQSIKQYQGAIASYEKAISLNPHFANAYSNMGNVLQELKQFEAAVASYDQAIKLKPHYFEAYSNRGNALRKAKLFEVAIASHDEAIKLNPHYAEAYFNRGNVYLELKKNEAAAIDYEQAIKINPHLIKAHFNQGRAFLELKLLDQALVNFLHASQLEPEMDYLIDYLIYTKLQLSNWEGLDILINRFIEKTNTKNKPCIPFFSLFISDQPDVQKKSAEIYANDQHPINNELGHIKKIKTHDKIRIGYFSADFRDHPVSYLTAQLFELHNRDVFEIIAFSLGPDTDDNLRKRLKLAFDKFVDVKEKTDQEITVLAREMHIDIAVDLGGFTEGARTNLFAMRVAPIQLSYIGYLGTMAADYYDYLVADRTIIPEDYQHYYTEKIAYLPSYQVNDTMREISEKIFTRSELGLPADGFVFCCFNNIYKITSSTFDSWMRILLAVKGSVLLILDDNQTATTNLRKEANRRGVSSDRLVFVKHLPMPDYLARYRIADLFLDTLPYNAGTTASDALRMGLPIITQMGQSFASRIAASLLNSVGLPELITNSQQAYELLAIELAISPQKLDAIKGKLLKNLPSSPLYNTKLFTHNLESAYKTMYQRYQEGLAPDHIKIT